MEDELGLMLEGGSFVGKDPRSMDKSEFKDMGFTKTPILKVIRAKCIDCCGGSQLEVKLCVCTTCPLWPYRMAKNPFTSRELTDDQANALKNRLHKAREVK